MKTRIVIPVSMAQNQNSSKMVTLSQMLLYILHTYGYCHTADSIVNSSYVEELFICPGKKWANSAKNQTFRYKQIQWDCQSKWATDNLSVRGTVSQPVQSPFVSLTLLWYLLCVSPTGWRKWKCTWKRWELNQEYSLFDCFLSAHVNFLLIIIWPLKGALWLLYKDVQTSFRENRQKTSTLLHNTGNLKEDLKTHSTVEPCHCAIH